MRYEVQKISHSLMGFPRPLILHEFCKNCFFIFDKCKRFELYITSISLYFCIQRKIDIHVEDDQINFCSNFDQIKNAAIEALIYIY